MILFPFEELSECKSASKCVSTLWLCLLPFAFHIILGSYGFAF